MKLDVNNPLQCRQTRVYNAPVTVDLILHTPCVYTGKSVYLFIHFFKNKVKK